jgi:hypothetical protein
MYLQVNNITFLDDLNFYATLSSSHDC